MADAADMLKGLLGDDADDKIKSVMNSLSENGGAGFDDAAQLRDIVSRLASSRGDPRADLLLSLRPYMRGSRQRSIDSAVKLLNLGKIAALLK